MDLKRKLLDLLERAHGEEKAFVQRLSDEERSAVGAPERWSAKDVIAHIAAWKKRTARELAAMASGESSPDFGGLAQFNATIFMEHRDLAWSDILDKSRQAHRLLREQIEAAPHAILTEPQASDWHDRPNWWLVVGRAYTHPLGHLARRYIERGNVDCAIGIQEGIAGLLLRLDESPDWRGLVHYRLASQYAGLGRTEEAVRELREAFRLDPGLVDWSKRDPHLDSMRGSPEVRSLYTDSESPTPVASQ